MASSLHPLEAQVLEEYQRMSNNLARLADIAQQLSQAQPELLQHMRPLEKKMGLAVTLFKASVWAVLVQREEQRDEEEHRQ